ncbi:MAG: thioredoxin domain-containing protein, partial [Acidimicrobiales bacterium]
RARAADRPVFLSVGYSSCHWCHVMAHESFEDDATAAALNDGFVSVKVDREERPDVDAIYMEAVQAMTGRGGWPMTVFLTPDGRPFFGGTYFPRHDMPGMPGFPRVLEAVGGAWRKRRGEVERQADAMADAIARRITLPDDLAGGAEAMATGAHGLLDRAVRDLSERFDGSWGGFGPAPKFPQPTLVELCLLHYRVTRDQASLAMAETTLAAMAAGGIFDHLGGGFSRYSTDASWTVPHFEKMLYDQAGLVRAYLHAWQVTGDGRWLQVVQETIGYVLRDLAAPGGGLYSAEDADSEGDEGRFYVWSTAELDATVGAELAATMRNWYQVDDGGNFEGLSILRRPPGAALARPDEVEEGRRRLFESRARRVRPGLDDKVLTEWNAMFCAALAEAATATGRADWASAAVSTARFLLDNLRGDGGRWMRSWQGGRTRHLAYAADHAWLVDCLTRVGELTGQPAWLDEAAGVAAELLRLFGSGDGPLYTTGVDADALVVRPVEITDGATPSATSVAGAAMVRLGALRGDEAMGRAGESLLGALASVAREHALAVANVVAGAGLAGGGLTEVVVAGHRPDLLEVVRARYEPTAVVAWGERTGSALWEGREDGLAYVCRNYTCTAPCGTVEELAARLDAEVDADRARFAGSRP